VLSVKGKELVPADRGQDRPLVSGSRWSKKTEPFGLNDVGEKIMVFNFDGKELKAGGSIKL